MRPRILAAALSLTALFALATPPRAASVGIPGNPGFTGFTGWSHPNIEGARRHLAALRRAELAAERRKALALIAAARAIQQKAQAVVTAPIPRGPINWLAIARCESGGGGPPDWSYNGPSGFDGGLQFLPSTWVSAGGTRYAPYAWQATAAQQIAIASSLPLSNWPYCGRFG